MATRVTKKRKLQTIPTGDMNEVIGLHERNIKVPDFNSSSFSECYILITEAWAKIETKDQGEDVFDDVNIKEQISHVFTIRFLDGITTEAVISWNGEYYKIVQVVNLDERQEFLELHSRLLGEKVKEANT